MASDNERSGSHQNFSSSEHVAVNPNNAMLHEQLRHKLREGQCGGTATWDDVAFAAMQGPEVQPAARSAPSMSHDGDSSTAGADWMIHDNPISGEVTRVFHVSFRVWEKYNRLADRAARRVAAAADASRPAEPYTLRPAPTLDAASFLLGVDLEGARHIRMGHTPPAARRCSTPPVPTTIHEHHPPPSKPASWLARWRSAPCSVLHLPILPPTSRFARSWAMGMLVLDGLYIAFLMPISAAFCSSAQDELTWCTSIDLAAGCLYAVNLLLSFHVGVVLACGYKRRTLHDSRLVSRFYITHGGFWMDALAVVPFIMQSCVLALHLHNDWLNRTLSFVMLARLMRLGALLRTLFVDSISRAGKGSLLDWLPMSVMYALIMLYTILVLMNLLTCIVWLVAVLEGPEHSWLRKVEWTDDTEALFGGGPIAYLAACYWVVTTISTTGYGDISPTTPGEVVLAMVFMLCGVSLFALLIGTVAQMLAKTTAEARSAGVFFDKMMEVHAWMDRRGLPGRLRRAIAAYYGEVWQRHSQSASESVIFAELPHYLRARAASVITRDLLTRLEPFTNLDLEAAQMVASRMMPLEVAPGHELCREGDTADGLWLLQEGEMLVLRHMRPIELLSSPVLLGECVLLAHELPQFQHRLVTYRAVSACHLWQLQLKDLMPLLHALPALHGQLLDGLRQALMKHLYEDEDAASAGSDSGPSRGRGRGRGRREQALGRPSAPAALATRDRTGGGREGSGRAGAAQRRRATVDAVLGRARGGLLRVGRRAGSAPVPRQWSELQVPLQRTPHSAGAAAAGRAGPDGSPQRSPSRQGRDQLLRYVVNPHTSLTGEGGSGPGSPAAAAAAAGPAAPGSRRAAGAPAGGGGGPGSRQGSGAGGSAPRGDGGGEGGSGGSGSTLGQPGEVALLRLCSLSAVSMPLPRSSSQVEGQEAGVAGD